VRRARLLLIALVCLGSLLGAASAGAAEKLVWTSNALSGIGIQDIDTHLLREWTEPGVVEQPYGTAFDSSQGRVYFPNTVANTIGWLDLESGEIGTLDTGSADIDLPEGIAIDPADGRVYWANSGDDTIAWAALDGSGSGLVDTGDAPIEEPCGVVVDPASGRIYWASYWDNAIGWANLDGSGAGELNPPEELLEGPAGLAIDAADNRVYWANWDTGTIAWASLDGVGSGEVEVTGVVSSAPAGIAIDPRAERIYWGEEEGGVLLSAPLDGGEGKPFTIGYPYAEPAFPILIAEPETEAAPTVTGERQVGSTLDCSVGWQPDLVESFYYRMPETTSYEWTRDGAPLAATGAELVPTEPGDYACAVTGTNVAGATHATAAAVEVAAAPPDEPEEKEKPEEQEKPETPGRPTTVLDSGTGPAPVGAAPSSPVPAPRLKLVKVTKDRRSGVATIAVEVSGPGTLELAGKDVVARRVVVRAAGTLRVPVRVTGALRKQLIEARRAKVALAVTFTAADGGTAQAKRTVALVRDQAGSGKEHRAPLGH
jgi:hypothetical protein